MWLLTLSVALAAAPAAMTLDEATLRLAEAPDLAVAQARADVAWGIARQARAAWLPTLQVGGTYTHNDHEVVVSFANLFAQLPVQVEPPKDLVIQPGNVWGASVSARVPLVAPSAWADEAAARRSAMAASATAEEWAATLEATLWSLAAAAEGARGAAQAAERAIALAERRLHVAEVALAAGTGTELEVLAARADLARRRGDALAARADADRLAEAVGALLGLDGAVEVALPEGSDTAGDGDRASIRAAALQVEAADRRAQAALWRHAPVVGATGFAATQTVPYATGYDTAWRVGLDAQWTLYDGGLRYGRLDQARAERAVAEAQLTAERLKVAREQRDAERALAVATEQRVYADEQAAAASAAAAIADRGFEVGTLSGLAARQAADDAYRAEVGALAARARLRAAEAELRRARGGAE